MLSTASSSGHDSESNDHKRVRDERAEGGGEVRQEAAAQDPATFRRRLRDAQVTATEALAAAIETGERDIEVSVRLLQRQSAMDWSGGGAAAWTVEHYEEPAFSSRISDLTYEMFAEAAARAARPESKPAEKLVLLVPRLGVPEDQPRELVIGVSVDTEAEWGSEASDLIMAIARDYEADEEGQGGYVQRGGTTGAVQVRPAGQLRAATRSRICQNVAEYIRATVAGQTEAHGAALRQHRWPVFVAWYKVRRHATVGERPTDGLEGELVATYADERRLWTSGAELEEAGDEGSDTRARPGGQLVRKLCGLRLDNVLQC